ASLQERIVSTLKNAITTFEAIYVPSDDLTDSVVQAIFPYLASGLILSREVYQTGHFPAMDILASNSSSLNPDTVGDEHYNAAVEAQAILKKAKSLERIVSLIGESELSADDQTTYKRAKFITNYMTQNFTVVETQTGKKGVHVTLKETLADVKAILSGKVDSLDPDDLMFIGTLKDVEDKLASKHPISHGNQGNSTSQNNGQPPTPQPNQQQ